MKLELLNWKYLELTIMHHVIRVYVTDLADDIIKKYKLSDAMVRYLANSYGGYPIADERIERALIKRGLHYEIEHGAYSSTELLQSLEPLMFIRLSVMPDGRLTAYRNPWNDEGDAS